MSDVACQVVLAMPSRVPCWSATPPMTGTWVLTAGRAATTAVGWDDAMPEPVPLVAVTMTEIFESSSAFCRT